MRLNLSRYNGVSFDVAVDVLDAMVDDVTRLIEGSPDGCLTPERLAEYRSQAIRDFYATHGIQSGRRIAQILQYRRGIGREPQRETDGCNAREHTLLQKLHHCSL